VEVKAEVKSLIHGKRKATVNTASSKSNKKAKKRLPPAESTKEKGQHEFLRVECFNHTM
jgi:hypothetical protein